MKSTIILHLFFIYCAAFAFSSGLEENELLEGNAIYSPYFAGSLQIGSSSRVPLEMYALGYVSYRTYGAFHSDLQRFHSEMYLKTDFLCQWVTLAIVVKV